MPVEGEVEKKLNGLCKDIWNKFKVDQNGEDEEHIPKDQFTAYIKEIMEETGNEEHYDEDQYEACYKQIDFDGTGKIEWEELKDFVKRFANL